MLRVRVRKVCFFYDSISDAEDFALSIEQGRGGGGCWAASPD